jgi:predicted ester cyclase
MPVSPELLCALSGYERMWRAELFGVPPAGRHVSFTETHIVRMRGDRVREHRLQVGLLTQLTS